MPKSKPEFLDASITFVGGKPITVVTLRLDPRDTIAIAAEHGCTLGDEHTALAKQLDDDDAPPAKASKKS